MKGQTKNNPVTRYTLTEFINNKQVNKFLDRLISFSEVKRITLANHLLATGWEDCDVDLDVEFEGGTAGVELSSFLNNYKRVNGFWGVHKKHNHGQIARITGKFRIVGGYYLQIGWGCGPYSVPYVVLREQKIKRKKPWLK